MTHEQCAQAAARAGYEVFAMQYSGNCFMGTLADVAQMKWKLDDAKCNTIPCLSKDGCAGWTNRVYSIGACSAYPHLPSILVVAVTRCITRMLKGYVELGAQVTG
jgi:hypothetical protein